MPVITNDKGFLHTRGLRIITVSETLRAEQGRMPLVMRNRSGLPLDARCTCGL